MKSIVTTLLSTLKVFLLFVSCTLLFYYGMVWIDHEYKSYHKYDEPQGDVMKVDSTNEKPIFHWLGRLSTFYKIGE